MSYLTGLSNVYQIATAASNQAYGSSAAGGSSFRNKVINGDMRIDQRNGGTAVTIASDDVFYGPDRLLCYVNTYSGTPSFTLQQQTLSTADTTTLGGRINSVRLTATNANTMTNSYGSVGLQYLVEGYNITDLNWGAAGAQSMAVSMWMKTNVTGVHNISFGNRSYAQSYVASFNLNAADTWSNVKFVVPAPPTGSVWDTTSNVGIRMDIDAISQGYTTTFSNAWYNGFALTPSSNNSSLWLNSNNYVEVTGIQLEAGTSNTPFENRPLPIELGLCQRYFEKSFPYNTVPQNNIASTAPGDTMYFNNLYGMGYVSFKNPKKSIPTVGLYNPSSTSGNIRTSSNVNTTALPNRTTTAGMSIITTDSNLNNNLGYFNWKAESEYKQYDPNPSVGKVAWATRLTGPSSTKNVLNLSATSDGGFVAGGVYISSNITAYNTTGIAGLTMSNSSPGTSDMFVAKYTSSGNVQWAAHVGGASNESFASISSTLDGGIVMSGYYNSPTVTAYHATGTTFGTTLTNMSGGSSNQAIIIKYNSTGTTQWITQLTGQSNVTQSFASCETSDGGVIVTGNYTVSTVTAYHSTGTSFGTTLTNSGGTDAFIAKYNTSGTCQWLARAGSTAGSGSRNLNSVCETIDGSVVVAGVANTVITAYNANTSAFGTTLPNSGTNDVYLVKYNASGTVQWITRIAGTAADNITNNSMCSTSDGGVVIVGYYASTTLTAYNADGTSFGTTLPNAGSNDAFVAKYNSSGMCQWIARAGGNSADLHYGVTITNDGGICVVGYGLSPTLTAYHASGIAFGTTNSQIGSQDGYVIKYNSVGTVQWIARFGGSNSEQANCVCALADGIVVGGLYISTYVTVYDASGSAFGMTLDNSNTTAVGEGYLIKYTDTAAPLTLPLAQNRWVAQQSSAGTDWVQGVTTLTNGTVVAVGYYTSTLTMYNAAGTAFGTTLSNAGGNDAFLVAYNSFGAVTWTAKVSGTGSEQLYAVATLNDGGIVVCGQSASSTLTAYNAVGTAFGTTLSNAGTTDAFLVKYNLSGVVQWIARASGTSDENAVAACATQDGGLVVSGMMLSSSFTAYHATGAAFGTTLTNSGSNDAWLAKYNTSGTVQWIARLGGTLADYIYGVCCLSDGGVVVAGNYASTTLTAYNASGSAFGTTLTNSTTSDAFLAKYSTAGVVQWVARLSGSAVDTINAVCGMTDGGVAVVGNWNAGILTAYHATGTAFGTTLPAPSNNDVFVAKYNTSGTVQWITRMSGTGHDYAHAICAMLDGGIAVAGIYSSTILTSYNADGSAFGTTLLNFGNYDAYIASYDTNGYMKCVASFCGAADERAVALASCPDGDIVVGGAFSSTSFSLQGAPTSLAANGGTYDGYVAKYGLTGAPLPVTSGTVQWIAQLVGASTTTTLAQGVCATSDGGVVVTGYSNSGTLTVYNATGTAFGTTLSSSTANNYVFVAKYSSSGAVQWVTRVYPSVAGAANFLGSSICSTNDGGILMTGYSTTNGGYTVVAYNANGSAFGTTVTYTSSDVFVVKYNSSGVVQWITSVRGNSSGNTTLSTSILGTSDGGMVVCGYYWASTLTAYHATGAAFGTTLSNSGNTDMYVIKYNSSGTCQWTTRVSGTGSETSGQVCCASDGSIVVNGYSASATVTTYNATGVASSSLVNSSSGTSDSFIVKYDSTGVVQWVALAAGSSANNDRLQEICSTSDGGYVSAGYYYSSALTAYNANGAAFGTVLTNPAGAGAFSGCMIKYNSSGNVQWVAQTTSWITGVTSTTDGGILLTAMYSNFTAYNATGSTYGTTLTSSGGTDGYIVKYSSSGIVEWCTKVGSTGEDQINQLCSTADGCLVAVGQYTSTTFTAYHANGTSFGTTLALSSASNNAFIVKYSM